MKKTKVVSGKNRSVGMPLNLTLLWALVLDRLRAPGWVWGVVGTLAFVLWCVWIYGLFIYEPIDIFKDKP